VGNPVAIEVAHDDGAGIAPNSVRLRRAKRPVPVARQDGQAVDTQSQIQMVIPIEVAYGDGANVRQAANPLRRGKGSITPAAQERQARGNASNDEVRNVIFVEIPCSDGGGAEYALGFRRGDQRAGAGAEQNGYAAGPRVGDRQVGKVVAVEMPG